MNNSRTRVSMITQGICKLDTVNVNLELSEGGGNFYVHSSDAYIIRLRDGYVDIPTRVEEMHKLPSQSPWSTEYRP